VRSYRAIEPRIKMFSISTATKRYKILVVSEISPPMNGPNDDAKKITNQNILRIFEVSWLGSLFLISTSITVYHNVSLTYFRTTARNEVLKITPSPGIIKFAELENAAGAQSGNQYASIRNAAEIGITA